MDSDKKLEFLTVEVMNIKQSLRDGSKISDDSRKAIIHDIGQIEKEHRNKRLLAIATVFTVIVSLLSYVGFQSLKHAVSEEVTKSEIKDKILLELTKEKKALTNDLLSTKEYLVKLKKYDRLLEDKYIKLQNEMDVREEKIHHLINVLSKSEIDKLDFNQLIDSDFQLVLSSINTFDFIKSFGITEHSVIKVLTVHVYDFEPSKITKDSLTKAIINLQQRFALKADGALGPCTSLVVGALLNADFPFVASQELDSSQYKEQKWLTNSFQACSKKDKENIGRYMDYPDLPLHKELNNFVEAAQIDREVLMQSMRNYKVNGQGYKALEYLGYGLSGE